MFNRQIRLQDESTDIHLDLQRRVTLIPGDNGSGKTFLCQRIRRIQSRQPLAAEVFVVDDLEAFMCIPSCKPKVVIIDKMEQYLGANDLVDMVSAVQDKYFLIFVRSGVKMPATLRDIAALVWEHGEVDTASLRYYWSNIQPASNC